MLLGTIAYAKGTDTDKKITDNVILDFIGFDMSGYKAYQSIEIPKGTPESDLSLPDVLTVRIEGQEENVDMPVTWECTDDGFGGGSYQAGHENEDAVFTFMPRWEENFALSGELQQKADNGEIKLPWIEVKYQKGETKEDSEKEMASGEEKQAKNLEPDSSYPQTATNTTGTLKFLTGSSAISSEKAFDIRGLKDGSEVKTTYSNYGYELYLTVGDVSVDRGNMELISSLNNGQVKTVNGMQVQPLITFTSDQAYVKVTYKVYNPADTAKVIGLCGGADIMIGGDDKAAINSTSTGITMVEGSKNGSQFSLYSKNTFGVTALDTLWFGEYNQRQYNYWNSREGGDLPQGTDSGIAFSWQNRALAPHASTEFTLLFGVGEPAAPPEIDIAADIELAYSAADIGVKAKVKDADTRTYNVYYSLDDGQETILDATLKTLVDDNFTEDPGTHKGTDPIAADGKRQGVAGEIPVPEEWAENSVHKLQIWVKNDKYAMSDVKTVYIMKKAAEGGGEIVEANEYSLAFDANGGSGTPPASMKAYEGTDVVLPVTALQNDGYLFGGWTPDDGTTIYQPGESYTMPSQDTTLKAFWYQTLTPGEVAPVTAEYGTEIAPVALSATGGRGNLTYAVAPGTPLPAGLVLTEEGILSGTPTDITNGQVLVKVIISDAMGETAEAEIPMTIDKRQVTVSGAQTTEKEYDADTSMDVGALALDNVLSADSISAAATAEFTTIDAAENKDITLSGITLSGTNAEKYSCEETVVIKGKIIPRTITVKVKDDSKKAGTQKPEPELMEVYDGTSALQGTDTLEMLGTPRYAYPDFKDETGSYRVVVSFDNANRNYNIICQEGTLSVGQDAPVETTNYQVSGIPGNGGWYTSPIIIKPLGDTYDMFADGTASIEVNNKKETIQIQLKDSRTGQLTSPKTVEFKSDTEEPRLGTVSVQEKNRGILSRIGRTLTFGNFFKETVQVTLPVTDNLSGVEKLEYRLPGEDGYTVVTLDQTVSDEAVFDIPLGTNGIINVRATDMAGNINQVSNLEKDGADVWIVENTAPVISEFTAEEVSKNGWYRTDVTLTASVTDEESGLNQVSWTLNDGDSNVLLGNPEEMIQEYQFNQTLTNNGKQTVKVSAEDNATNQSADRSITVQIDKEIPTLSSVEGNPENWQEKEAEISFKIKDEISGLDKTEDVQVLKDGNTPIAVIASGDTYTFTTKGNGKYTVKAMDKAGNEIAESDCIIVSRIKDPEPKPPINDESLKGQKGTAVKTGDALSAGKILFYLILAIAALGCIAMCMIVKQKSAQAKRRHRRNRR